MDCHSGNPKTRSLDGSEPSTETPTALRARLAQIDAEMEDIQSRLDHLDMARKPVVEALKSVVYPILSLPPEITAEIFVQYVDADHPPDLHINRSGPLLLASICKAWRDLALELQSIWSRIRIHPSPKGLASTEDVLRCWLARAGTHPLELDLQKYCPTSDCPVFATLLPYSMQWQEFSCRLLSPIPSAIEDIRSRIPTLRKLKVIQQRDRTVPTPIAAFSDAPLLREVYLSNVTLQQISLPWMQLTTLECYGQDAAQCVQILQHCPNLESLTADTFHHPITEPVRLAHLRTLKFHNHHFGFLDCLILPSLTSISLLTNDSSSLSTLNSFIERSGCALRSVTLHSLPSTMAVPILQSLSTVANVSIVGIFWYRPDFTQLFARITTDAAFLPSLRSLDIEHCENAIELPYPAIAKLLAARRSDANTSTARLESLRFVISQQSWFEHRRNCATTVMDAAIRAIRVFAAEGCEIHLRGLHVLDMGANASTHPLLNSDADLLRHY
ncbi:hypothetical protein C8R43DRAFT_309965 [Mycena crocata]|nr:hypothetical protein C8R43DRAFT_309965 [Mycena crocata]